MTFKIQTVSSIVSAIEESAFDGDRRGKPKHFSEPHFELCPCYKRHLSKCICLWNRKRQGNRLIITDLSVPGSLGSK